MRIPKPALVSVKRQIVIPKTIRRTLLPNKITVAPKNIIAKGKSLNKSIPIVSHKRIITKGIIKKQEIQDKSKDENTKRDEITISKLQNTGIHKALIIISNGPSVNEVQLHKLLNHKRIDILSINKPVPSLWPTKYWMFCDNSQYNRHQELWDSYNGLIINTAGVRQRRPNSVKIKTCNGFGFSLDMRKGLHVGRSTTYAAMQIANWMNYDEIFIFGCDMSGINKNGKLVTHFFGNNPDVKPENRVARFGGEAKHYDHAAKELPERTRNKYVFCSNYNKYSFIKKFNNLNHLEAVDFILKKYGNQETT